jgi:hypothetical protein
MDLRFLSRNAESAKRSRHLLRRSGVTFTGAKIWERSEDDVLRTTVELTVSEVQKRLPHRTANAIERRREKLGLVRRKLKPWTTLEDRVLHANIERMTPAQCARDGQGTLFFLDRAKTGRAAAGTLTRWSEAILLAYLKRLGVEIHNDAPIFRNRSGAPYSKDTLGDDFRAVREAIDANNTRQLADMRRSGAVEGDAGGGTVADQSNKMANTVCGKPTIRSTWPASADSMKPGAAGAKALEQKPSESVIKPDLMTLLERAVRSNPLK